ncbi:MAG TPA: hypothetical protein DEB16_00130 [Ruminococcaceae bacterium]|jgi:hypothetical protein|nr:hypothetical protein [Oscillospiraceae bacterium]HBG55072.1 hypothetical protein [Oscillospiraceae bacterium]HBQ45745.1 hypothetical protein [Oscillospiraceae bacterium]HBT90236.1 hypothetical protein [Oscillospiraceae bacterium]HCB90502.1 hypothetical protein [Oscillospiraceae bacterium]
MKKEVDWHQRGLIPILLYFQNGGTYTGSVGNRGGKEFRYRVGPADGKIRAEAWYGPFCYEKSKIVRKADFPMDEAGRSAMLDWLKAQYEAMVQ